jgi:hypothetical protein
MPLKHVTPSFTVEYRQNKRPNTGGAKPGWAHAQPAPKVAGKEGRVAMSAFKTTAAHSPAEVVSPSIPRGRILPSLVETLAGTGQAEAERAQSRGGGSAAKAGSATQVPGDGTVARRPGGTHIFSRRPRAVGGSRSHGPSVRESDTLGPERIRRENAKIEEADSSSCRKAREVRSCF